MRKSSFLSWETIYENVVEVSWGVFWLPCWASKEWRVYPYWHVDASSEAVVEIWWKFFHYWKCSCVYLEQYTVSWRPSYFCWNGYKIHIFSLIYILVQWVFNYSDTFYLIFHFNIVIRNNFNNAGGLHVDALLMVLIIKSKWALNNTHDNNKLIVILNTMSLIFGI